MVFGSVRPLAGSFARSAARLALAILVGAGCGGSAPRMGEGEALRYKLELIRGHRGEITPVQADKLLYYPGRTRPEIDRYFAQLREETRLERELEARRLEEAERKPAPEEPGGPGGPSGAE